MLAELLRLLAEIGPQIIWVFIFIATMVAVFVIYTGIALHAVLRPRDPRQQEINYRVFRDLLDLFHRGRNR